MLNQNGHNSVEPIARTHRVSWRNALSSVFGAASRLHQYREAHTRMVYEALCGIDCPEDCHRCNDE